MKNEFLTMHLKDFKYYLLSSVQLLKGLSDYDTILILILILYMGATLFVKREEIIGINYNILLS
jgi:hypothetical protein